MNHVNHLIWIALSFTIISDRIRCHEENPKLTVELMSSGFHRYESIVNLSITRVKCELIFFVCSVFVDVSFVEFTEIWSMWSSFQSIRANIIHSSLNNNCRLLFTLVPINWMIWNDSIRYWNYFAAQTLHSRKLTLCFVSNFRSIISSTRISSTLKCRQRNPNHSISICLVTPHFCKPFHCPYIFDIMHPAIEGK